MTRWITVVVLVTILSACEETSPSAGPPEADTPELTGTVWVLESLMQGESVSDVGGERATLELFSDGSMLGSTGCRALNGRYTMAGDEVAMAELSAHGECPVELRDQDVLVVRVLGDGFGVEVDGEILTLTTGSEGLAYRAAP